AADVASSKASLYYYFPDKHSLYAASLTYVIQQSFADIEPTIGDFVDCKEAMLYLLDKRIEFVAQYHNLLEYSVGATRQLPREMNPIFDKARKNQEYLIAMILEKGVRSGQLKPIEDLAEVSKMLLFALEGMRFSILRKAEEPIFPSTEEFAKILRLQKRMVVILLDGLAVR